MSKKYTVALIGCGKMGGALLEGWLATGLRPADVLVVDPRISPDGVAHASSVEAVAQGITAETVVLAVKPQGMADIAATSSRLASPSTVFLSIAAGKTIGFFQAAIGDAARIVRAMPNTPSAIGRGVIGLCAGPGVTDRQRQQCEKLLGPCGMVAWVETESLMDVVTAVSGSGPAYVFHLVEAMAHAGMTLGLPADLAMMLARQTVIGSAALMTGTDTPVDQLRINVTSPGGTTAAALDILMDRKDGMLPLFTRAIAAATRRGKDLGRKESALRVNGVDPSV